MYNSDKFDESQKKNIKQKIDALKNDKIVTK